MAHKPLHHIVWFSWKDLSHPLAGGAEVVTDQLLRRLVADGHEVVLLCGGFKGGAAEEFRNGYKMLRMGNRVTVYLHAWLYYRKHLKQWATMVVDECNTVPFFASWYAGRGKKGYNFFHMLCRKIWFYELPKPLGLVGYLAEPMYLQTLRRWPAITVSRSTKADLIGCGYTEKNISIICEGITMQPVTSLSGIPKYKNPTLLSFGTMRSMKNTLDQVTAFEIAKRTMPDLQLKMAGDPSGTYGAKVLKAVKNSLYTADISLLGRVTATKKQELMRRSHVLVVSSVKEGWGLVVTEAASQGTPSIVYDVDGLRDSVQNGKTGIISQPNPTAMANGVVALLQDKATYATMQANGHTWSKQITFNQSYSDFKRTVRL